MKTFILLVVSAALSCTLAAQNTVRMNAVKGNNFGVNYSLPKTSIKVTAEYTKTTLKAGQYYQYAERYLNISNPIIENEVQYTLDALTAETEGVIDSQNSYQVEFRANTTAPYVTLTEDGLICAINSDYDFVPNIKQTAVQESKNEAILNPNTFLSEEILRAGSTAKQAELIAKQIYRLRESRTNILTGEADNMPPDGAAYELVMNQLDAQEKALMAMFIGTKTTEKGLRTFTVIPDKQDIEREILFRFSSKLGVVEPNDLSGAPVYISLTNKEPRVEQELTEKEAKEMEKKFSKGIIYNVPGKGSLKITYNNKAFVNKECDIVQYGIQDVLAPNMFDNNKRPIKVIFYPKLGAIQQIIQ